MIFPFFHEFPDGDEICVGDDCVQRNCSWTEWGSWRSCSRSCGVGQQQRIRTFVSPGTNGSWCDDILEGNLENRFCNIKPCKGQETPYTASSIENINLHFFSQYHVRIEGHLILHIIHLFSETKTVQCHIHSFINGIMYRTIMKKQEQDVGVGRCQNQNKNKPYE